MSKIFLITHPEVNIQPHEKIDEWTLSDIGIARAQSLSRELFLKKIDSIYTSTEPKAKTVAEMVTRELAMPLVEKECLVEIDRSSTGYLPFDEFMDTVRQFFSEPSKSVRGWETADDATHRIVACLDAIVENNTGEQIALIGHGALFTLLQCHIKGIGPTIDMDQEELGSIAEIDWGKKEVISNWRRY